MVPGNSVFPLSESGMSRNFWGRIKGAKYRFAPRSRGRGSNVGVGVRGWMCHPALESGRTLAPISGNLGAFRKGEERERAQN